MTRSAVRSRLAPPFSLVRTPNRLVIDRRRRQRDYDLATHAGTLERKTRAAAQFGRDAAFDQLAAEATLLRLGNHRPLLLDPIDPQQLVAIAGASQLPVDFDAAAGQRQGAVFRRIG